jgi:hypothetical protein
MKKVNRNVRLSEEFYHYVKSFSELRNRSIASQIEYWTKLGIIMEENFDNKEISEYLNKYRNIFELNKE